ncbi:MAG: type II toxin-antitoxin system RelE/ParE family toxin [Candidatus Gastranaerophilales bacterium]|nr:type II toxin-antitoxin system RelE/ParE family toxin [Candidatus Gastranaerophilales bacterium]
MIKSFSCKETEKIYNGKFSKKLPCEIQSRALVKLHSIDVSEDINDLRTPPSNHLEILSGDRKGQYSIKINNQYRICFNWVDSNALNVEITDYHD